MFSGYSHAIYFGNLRYQNEDWIIASSSFADYFILVQYKISSCLPLVLYGESIQPLQLVGHPGLGQARESWPAEQEVGTVAPVEVGEHDPHSPAAAQLCVSASHLLPNRKVKKESKEQMKLRITEQEIISWMAYSAEQLILLKSQRKCWQIGAHPK